MSDETINVTIKYKRYVVHDFGPDYDNKQARDAHWMSVFSVLWLLFWAVHSIIIDASILFIIYYLCIVLWVWIGLENYPEYKKYQVIKLLRSL